MKIFFSFLTLSLTFSSLVSAEIFDWDQNKDYNAGVTVVVKEGDNAGSYRSLQSVSAGIPITSTDFWYNLFLESNLPDYVKAGENPDEEGLNEALSGGTPNIEDIPEELPPDTDTSTGGGDTSTGGGDTSTGGGDTSTGGGDTNTGGGDTSTGGGDTSTGGGDTSTGGGDTSTGGGDTSTGGGDTNTGGGDTNSGGTDGVTGTAPSAQILGLSIRGGVYGSVMSGSLTLGGTSEAKNILFRVKGPSMNFGGPKLTNPTIKALSKASGSWQTLFEANDFGDHSSATTYSDRGTGNSLEPIAVIEATPGTFSCQMNAEDGGTGNANMEIKGFEDENSSTYFQGISMRGYIGEYPMSGSLTIVGTGSVDVMFRVKGPSMNFGGEKLSDPKIKLLQRLDGAWTTLFDSSSFGDHSSSTTYADRATGNSLEPMVVLSLQAGTYSCQASSDITGDTGNANMEIKLVE